MDLGLSGGIFTGKLCAQEFAFLVGEGVSVIHVEISGAVWPGIDLELKWAFGRLVGILDERLLGNDGAGAYIDRECVEGWIDLHLAATGLPFSGPVIDPIALRQRDLIASDKRPDLGSDQESAAEHEFFAVGGKVGVCRKFQVH